MSALDRRQLAEMVRVAGRVGVLMGGRSGEREVSLQSGQAVTTALCKAGIDATALDWAGSLDALLAYRAYDRFFVALHGRGGEDGQVQAALELLGLPYTGCAIAMDKYRSKLAWLGAGLPTPDFYVIEPHSDTHAIIAALGLPLIVKPAREGSSLGVSKVKFAQEFAAAVDAARRFDTLVLAERFVAGAEYTLSIVAGHTLPIIRLETPHEFYDYAAKYLVDTTSYICPCGLTQAEQAQAATRAPGEVTPAVERIGATGAVQASGWQAPRRRSTAEGPSRRITAQGAAVSPCAISGACDAAGDRCGRQPAAP